MLLHLGARGLAGVEHVVLGNQAARHQRVDQPVQQRLDVVDPLGQLAELGVGEQAAALDLPGQRVARVVAAHGSDRSSLAISRSRARGSRWNVTGAPTIRPR